MANPRLKPPTMPKPGPGVLRGRAGPETVLVLLTMVAVAAAVVAIFFAGYVAGTAAVLHG